MKWIEFSDNQVIHNLGDPSTFSYQIVEGSLEFFIEVSPGILKISKTHSRGELCGMIRSVDAPWL